MKKIIIAAFFLAGVNEAHAASNPQRIAGGGLTPAVFVNVTGTNQSNARGIYTNQTQYTPATVAARARTLMGVGQ